MTQLNTLSTKIKGKVGEEQPKSIHGIYASTDDMTTHGEKYQLGKTFIVWDEKYISLQKFSFGISQSNFMSCWFKDF